jgi:hypothetical protein
MNPARIGHLILHSQGLKDFLRRDAQLRHLSPRHLHIDRFGTLPPKSHLGHISHQQQLPLQEFGDIPQFRIGIALASKAQKHPIGVAEIVVHD